MAGHGHDRRGARTDLTIVRVAVTGSTNTDMMAHAVAGEASEGDWLVAERQSGGRGRAGREWQSLEGNLHASTLVRLHADDPPPQSLALVAGIALQEALPETARLKWPNDVLIDGAKVAGVLLERQGEAIVIGFGVNIAEAPALADRRTTCLAEHANGLVTVDSVLAALDEAFARRLSDWRAHGVATTIRRWGEIGHRPGEALRVRLPDGEGIEGRYDGLDVEGALRLRLADGTLRVIHAGDVALI